MNTRYTVKERNKGLFGVFDNYFYCFVTPYHVEGPFSKVDAEQWADTLNTETLGTQVSDINSATELMKALHAIGLNYEDLERMVFDRVTYDVDMCATHRKPIDELKIALDKIRT